MALDLWLTFVAASVVLLIIPGPTILLVLSYALTQGRRVAVSMALGVALGDLIAPQLVTLYSEAGNNGNTVGSLGQSISNTFFPTSFGFNSCLNI